MNVQLMDCRLHCVAFGALTEMSVIDLNKGYHPSPSSIGTDRDGNIHNKHNLAESAREDLTS